ncbi:MAG: Flavohemoprotein [Spirochaetes bacterium ADurb.Bin110]|nr:MAG: Flavohemoprotein [Spirochaetes bacterium ADurb.Bin110]
MANPVKLKATVTHVQPFGKSTYQVQFEPHGVIPKFKAGQFLHLAIDEYDPMGGFWPESRVFSIASALGSQKIEILYSVKGNYTARMQQELYVGREVWLKLPYGSFIIDNLIHDDQDVVLVAGGTGISPFLPYLQLKVASIDSSDSFTFNRVLLYYGVRENNLLVALDTIKEWSGMPFSRARIFIEDEDPIHENTCNLSFEKGRLDIGQIFEDSRILTNPVFFLSGPPAMIFSFKDKLLSYGVPPDNIAIDEWE